MRGYGILALSRACREPQHARLSSACIFVDSRLLPCVQMFIHFCQAHAAYCIDENDLLAHGLSGQGIPKSNLEVMNPPSLPNGGVSDLCSPFAPRSLPDPPVCLVLAFRDHYDGRHPAWDHGLGWHAVYRYRRSHNCFALLTGYSVKINFRSSCWPSIRRSLEDYFEDYFGGYI